MEPIVLNYTQLRQLRSDITHPSMLPFTISSKPISMKQQKRINYDIQSNDSQLLMTALAHTKKKNDKLFLLTQAQQKSLSSRSHSQQLQPLKKSKKAKKETNHKHITANSQLFQIKSQDQEKQPQQCEIRLNENILGQTQAVYEYVFGHPRQLPPMLINKWKQCLSHEDNLQIYGNKATFSYARIFPINQLQKGFSKIYGKGKLRQLYGGQQSVIISSIEKYLQKCINNPQKFARKAYDIVVNDILPDTKLQSLEQYPFCIRQIQAHFMLMATKWRYSGRLNLKDKIIESCLLTGKTNIIDLKKNNPLTKFFLERCKQNKK